ncbi:hypothetical protein WDU94_000725 [Cyamophila willieti]
MSKEHNISTIAAQTAYIQSQHNLKLAEIKRLKADINEVTRKTTKMNEKMVQAQEKKKAYKTKQKDALADRERQLLSNEYLSQAVSDLENQAKALHTEVTDLEDHCKGSIQKNETKLLKLRKNFSDVPTMMELTRIQLEEDRLVRENETHQMEIDQLERKIDEVRIEQKQRSKNQIIALLEHSKLKWNLENLPAKHRLYNEQLKTLQQDQDQTGKRLSSTKKIPNGNVSAPPVSANDLDTFFSFRTPTVMKKISLQNQKQVVDTNNHTRTGNNANPWIKNGKTSKKMSGNNSHIRIRTETNQRSQESRQMRMDTTKEIQMNKTKEPRNMIKNGTTLRTQNSQQVQKTPENKTFQVNQQDVNKSNYKHNGISANQQTPVR